jgi:hypothetical protein
MSYLQILKRHFSNVLLLVYTAEDFTIPLLFQTKSTPTIFPNRHLGQKIAAIKQLSVMRTNDYRTIISPTPVVPKLCAAAPWGAAKYSTRPTNYDLFIQ